VPVSKLRPGPNSNVTFQDRGLSGKNLNRGFSIVTDYYVLSTGGTTGCERSQYRSRDLMKLFGGYKRRHLGVRYENWLAWWPNWAPGSGRGDLPGKRAFRKKRFLLKAGGGQVHSVLRIGLKALSGCLSSWATRSQRLKTRNSFEKGFACL